MRKPGAPLDWAYEFGQLRTFGAKVKISAISMSDRVRANSLQSLLSRQLATNRKKSTITFEQVHVG
jgi:hypothetical protein